MDHSLLLSKFSLNEIKSACGSDWNLIKQTLPEGGTLDNKEVVIKFLLRLYGTSILELSSFRELFLRSLNDNELKELAQNLNVKVSSDTPILIARVIAAKPWGPTSKLLKVFKNMGFDESYLPLFKERFKATEHIEVFETPPDTSLNIKKK